MAKGDSTADTRRILVYGVTGSGKSTLARRLSELTGIPWHSVDDLTWRPGWVAVPDEDQRQSVEAICAEPAWILDTAYASWLDVPLARVDLVVGLDYPRWFSLQRLVRRCVARIVDRASICNGNRETVRTLFARDSIVGWHFRSFSRKRVRIRGWAGDPVGPPLVRLTSARQTRAWLDELRRSARAADRFAA